MYWERDLKRAPHDDPYRRQQEVENGVYIFPGSRNSLFKYGGRESRHIRGKETIFSRGVISSHRFSGLLNSDIKFLARLFIVK